jgi:hypothetical protein
MSDWELQYEVGKYINEIEAYSKTSVYEVPCTVEQMESENLAEENPFFSYTTNTDSP